MTNRQIKNEQKTERKEEMDGETESLLCWPSSQRRGIDQHRERASLFPLSGEWASLIMESSLHLSLHAPFLSFHSIFLEKQSHSRQWATSLSHHRLTFKKQTCLAGDVGVKQEWVFFTTSGTCQSVQTHIHTYTHTPALIWCVVQKCQNPSAYCNFTSETIGESRSLQLNGPIMAATYKVAFTCSS